MALAMSTDQRIRKLLARGLSVESIARKIGRPGPKGEDRVRDTMFAINTERAERVFDKCCRAHDHRNQGEDQ